ncbi:MAG: ATP-binding protein [SAR202 cluster bacterium]|nr:ATP-binding protein [SAR202 cluster bacterium]
MTTNGNAAFDALGRKRLGIVVAGSLTDGVDVRLDDDTSVEDIKVGTLVAIEGERRRFFGQITDVLLGTTDLGMQSTPPDVSNSFIARVIAGTTAYGAIKVEPTLSIGGDSRSLANDGPLPAKTVPAHFSSVSPASDADIELVFGKEDERHFWIGSPLDMETKLCLNVEELAKRSNGVFGKSGTGKTFLTRLLLIGILQRSKAVNLVFDMHSEYGWQGTSEKSSSVKGLKQLFGSKVAVFTLDVDSSRRRSLLPDYVVRIGYDEVEPEDITLLREVMDLSSIAADAAYNLQRHFGKGKWLKSFLAHGGRDSIKELADAIDVNANSLGALHNRLSRFERFGFMDDQAGHDSVNEIIRYLDRGMHVVLEFGRYGNDLAAYILVANLLTRRIYKRYMERKEAAAGDKAKEPRPLVISIEEAHKFLTKELAGQTIFGTIARELRKYNVTLLVVDQRPSGIDDEVMSQLGTKIVCLLDSEKDVTAVLAGVSGSSKLRAVLSRLESRQQALAFGHALPMPVVVQTREYGTPEFYKSIGHRDGAEAQEKSAKDVEDLFGPGS